MSIAIKVMRDAGFDPSIALPTYETAGAAGARLVFVDALLRPAALQRLSASW